ncbi:MAG: type IV pilus assembly protein PilM [Thermoleophilia bacterium]|nr:type IV pilus assembly protein PilM [Thermoleophilia bacterium]
MPTPPVAPPPPPPTVAPQVAASPPSGTAPPDEARSRLDPRLAPLEPPPEPELEPELEAVETRAWLPRRISLARRPGGEPARRERRLAARRLPRPTLRLALPRGGGGKRIVGLEIGASQLAAAQVSNDGVPELHQLARQPLAPGVVVGGEVRDPDALAHALRAFFAGNRLPRKGVRLGVASNRIGVRVFEIAGVGDDRQLANAVRFRAHETLPIPAHEAILDYRVLDETVNDSGQPVKRVLLVVAHRELVERYVDACRKAGIVLSGIDLEAFALLRSLAPPTDRDGSALVAVAIGHERSTLAVSDGRVCEFTRVLEWGGWALNIALARVLDSTPFEVEGIKRGLSLAGGPAPEGLSSEQAAAVLDAVRLELDSLARELVSSLRFYQGQPGSLGIGEIVIAGGTAQMPGLAEELERLVGVRVRVGNPLGRLGVSKRVPESDLGSLAIAIGLGIED